MLEVLEQAQAAGQKIQQDALIGQASIFDLDEDAAAGSGAGARPSRPRTPPCIRRSPPRSSSSAELLAAEKEAIGLFVSAHPLKPLREALRARVDCPLSALQERRDKDLVTVGGIITEAKRIRTRNGDPMMFATLDDLAASVELLVFGKALAEHEEALKVDEVVLVKGRVDHKEAGKTCVIVQSVEPFAPSSEEIEQAQGAGPGRRSATPSCSRARAPARGRRRPLAGCARGSAAARSRTSRARPRSCSTSHAARASRAACASASAFRVQHTPALRAELEQALRRRRCRVATA